MEPLNDDQLNDLLREWRVPEAPGYLQDRVLARPAPWWRWLLTGSIRIPVPILLLSLLVVVAIVYSTRRPAPQPAGLVNFQPVKELNLRVIRSNYEQR